MKKLFAAICASTFLVTPTAFGTTTRQNVPIQARVKAACTVTVNPLNFGDVDPAVGATGTGTIDLNCTNGASVKLSLDDGLNAPGNPRSLKGDTYGDLLAYDVTVAAGGATWGSGAAAQTVVGSGAVQSITMFGSIAAGQTAQPDFYDDTLTLTVTY